MIEKERKKIEIMESNADVTFYNMLKISETLFRHLKIRCTLTTFCVMFDGKIENKNNVFKSYEYKNTCKIIVLGILYCAYKEFAT